VCGGYRDNGQKVVIGVVMQCRVCRDRPHPQVHLHLLESVAECCRVTVRVLQSNGKGGTEQRLWCYYGVTE
jgi:hypothetical protein